MFKCISCDELFDKFEDVTQHTKQRIVCDTYIVNFGEGCTDKLTDIQILTILERGYHSIPELIKVIHFSKNNQKNHGICVYECDSFVIKIYESEKWVEVDPDETVQIIFNDMRKFLIAKIKMFEERQHLNDKSKKIISKFKVVDAIIDRNLIKKQRILLYIKSMIYNM